MRSSSAKVIDRKYYRPEELRCMSYEELKKEGFISNSKERNNNIRLEFHALVGEGYKAYEAIYALADRHFMSEDTVRGILYRRDIP